MSYEVLARKWRPTSFNDVIGQAHILRALVNALDSGRIHHAYLFSGTRGVGKTTLARVLARALNCEKGVTSSPCGSCSSCTDIDGGHSVDLVEVDAASRTKVEETRDLLDNVQYLPSSSRYKIYLIDEVHMFSKHSFNALLKTLEEPPSHVKFLLATTDPKKVPVTVVSRCLQLNLAKVEKTEISDYLAKILGLEGISFEENGLATIAKNAGGSVRDALSLLDQAIAHGGGAVKTVNVLAMLGAVEQSYIISLLKCLAVGDGHNLIKACRNFGVFAPDYSLVLSEMLSILVKIATVQALGSENQKVEDDEEIIELAQDISAEDCQLFYQIALVGRRDLEITPDPESGFEMNLLRMLAFRREAFPDASNQENSFGLDKKKSERLVVQRNFDTAIEVELHNNRDWHNVVNSLNVNGLARELARHTIFIKLSQNSLMLSVASKHDKLMQKRTVETLEQQISSFFGREIKLSVAVAEHNATALSLSEQTLADELKAQKTVEKKVREDSTVLALSEKFDAVVTTVLRKK
jgi:DNA polymerase-3 subunit gamma/tau